MVMSRDRNADKVTILRLMTVSLQGGRVHILGNKLNKSKFYSERN